MTTPIRLLETLKEFIEKETELLMFGEEDKGGRRKPKVYIGYPPPKKAPVVNPPSPVPGVVLPAQNNQVLPPDIQKIFFENDEIYPFVIVRLLDFSDDEEGDRASASVRLIFGVKTYEHTGYIDVTHLAQTVRKALLETGVIGGAAEVQRPLLVTVYEDQPYPHWIADADVTFIVPTILRRFDWNG